MFALHSLWQSPAANALGWTLLHSLWQGAIVAAALALILWLFRGGSANVRYLFSAAALLCVFGFAVATFLRLDSASPVVHPIGASPWISQVSPAAIAPPPALSSIEHNEWAIPLLALLWAIGVVVLSLRHLAGWAVIVRLQLTALPIDPQLGVMFTDLSHRLGIARVVRLAQSGAVQIPTVVGWLDPLVLVPLCAISGLSAAQIRGLLAHELAHVRRYDYLANLIQTAIETLLFYHPAVWAIGRRIRQERENCCDDIATAICDRAEYASALAGMERLRPRPALAVSAGGGVLLPRIRRLLLPREGQTPKAAWITAALLTAIVSGGLVLIQPRAKADAPQTLSAGDYGASIYYIAGVSHDGIQRLPVTLRQAMLAGGLDDSAKGKSVTLFRRDSNAAVQKLAFDVSAIMSSATGDQAVEPGDVLFVHDQSGPATSQPADSYPEYYISGVPCAGPYSMKDIAIDIRQAVVAARFNDDPRTKSLILIRRQENGVDARQIMDMDQVINGRAGDLRLRANDVLLVEDRPAGRFGHYYMGGAVARPGQYELPGGGVSLLQALISAGVDPLKTPSEIVRVERQNTANIDERLKFDFIVGQLLDVGQRPFMLQPYDEIFVGIRK